MKQPTESDLRNRDWPQGEPTEFQRRVREDLSGNRDLAAVVECYRAEVTHCKKIKGVYAALAVLSHLSIYAAIFAVDRLHMTTVKNSAFICMSIIIGFAGTLAFSALSHKAQGIVAVYSQLHRSLEVFDGVTVRLPNRLNILYLRGFHAEAYATSETFVRGWSTAVEVTEHTGNYIRKCVASLKQLGEVFAALNLGEPPHTGISPDFHEICLYEFDFWPEIVRQMCDTVNLIVLHVSSDTEGLATEIAVVTPHTSKLVILIEEALIGDCTVWRKIISALMSASIKPLIISYKAEVLTEYDSGSGRDNTALNCQIVEQTTDNLTKRPLLIDPEMFVALCMPRIAGQCSQI